MDKFRKEPGAGETEIADGGRRFRIAIGQHAGCCVRSLASGLAALDHDDVRSVAAQLEREREADHTAANDRSVPGLHGKILEDWPPVWTPRSRAESCQGMTSFVP